MRSHLLRNILFVSILAVPCTASAEEIILLDSTRSLIATGADNSLERDASLFTIGGPRTNRTLATSSELTNIHAHTKKRSLVRLRNYTYSGEMRIVDEGGGVGVTFHSDYPRSDTYYRLRMYGGGSFHIAPHPDDQYTLEGTTDSNVVPTAGVWHKFRIVVRTARTRTNVRAKIWPLGTSAPTAWQITMSDSGENRIRRGKPGAWSMGNGVKEWRKLKVVTP